MTSDEAVAAPEEVSLTDQVAEMEMGMAMKMISSGYIQSDMDTTEKPKMAGIPTETGPSGYEKTRRGGGR